MKTNALVIGVLMGAALVLHGCTGMEERPDGEAAVEERSLGAEGGTASEAEASGARLDGDLSGRPLDDPANPLSKRIFYFAYDSSDLTPEDREIIMAHARYLAENPQLSVVVEGHTDERGSREYNLSLGDRRAQTVERLLLVQGSAKGQLQTISFGEERPASMEHDEVGWRLNRRVELLYSGY